MRREVHRRSGRSAHRLVCALLGASLAVVVALVVAVAADVAGTSRAVAAGIGRAPLHGREGIVPPGATLIGPAPSATSLPLEVTLQPRDPAALAAEVQAVSDPKSPEYRHFLTPAQFAQRFGPTQATIGQVTSALRSEGLTVGTPSSTGLSLPVSATVAEVQSAFSTSISRYRLASGKTGYDNRSTPEVPASVAPQIEGILGLDTLSPPQPTTTIPQASPASSHPTSIAAAPALAPWQPTPTPSCASNITGFEGALDADQLAQAYSFDPLYAANDYGAGATVALLELSGQAGYLPSDITNFAHCYGIFPGNGQITEKSVDGGDVPGSDTLESELDIENVLSLAPKANIEVYEGESSMYDVFSQIVSDDTAKIVSASWTNGCEAYFGQDNQSSENTLFQAAATEGQSIFVASGDEGSEGCNINGEVSAKTGSDPVAQAVDPSTGTLYIANKSSNTVSVDSEGSASDPTGFTAPSAGSVPTGSGSGPDAVALDASAGKVFVANAGGTITVISTGTCNQKTPSGCGSPTQIASGGYLSGPDALAVNGSTLYVGNTNNTVAVYSATSNAYVTTVTLPSLSHPTALAVDATNGFVYVADGTNNRIEYFNASTCNATTQTSCGATPTTVSVGADPVALAVASAAGDLYVANAGSGGGITVVGLTTHSVVKTISTSQPSNGTGLVQSVVMAPDNTQVLAVLTGLGFPGDVLATINTSTQSISATVNLQDGTDAMGQLVSDGTRDYVWALDETNPADIIQNLNLGVSDPASQPYVTAVGGTSVTAVGPSPTEKVWNDQLNYSEGAGGGGISQTFSMPAYQQPLGTVSGSSGTPCANSSGDCREVPDVSADADPSTGYVIYDSQNFGGSGWNALGGTSGAAPLWAAVLAVDASADGNTAGYGALNPALYLLAQQSSGTYLNDVTSGNNDYNATDSGSYPALAGYDMATGLGTPVASQLANGLSGSIPLDVVVSGTQDYGGTPIFSASANYAGSGSAPFGVTLNTSGLACTEVGTSTTIGPTLALGTDTLVASSCSGLTLSGVDAGDYTIVDTSAANDFTVTPAPLIVTASSGTMAYGSTPPAVTPSYAGFVNGDSASSLSSQPTCTTLATSSSPPSPPTYPSSCSGASDPNYAITYVVGATTVNPLPIPVAVSGTQADMGSPNFAATDSPPPGVTVDASSLSCGEVIPSTPISGSLPSGSYTLVAASCTGYTLSGSAAADYSVVITPAPGDFVVTGGPSQSNPSTPPPVTHGYWLVGSDGGIFTFGSANFYGSTGSLKLQRPVVGITPTKDRGGYWLVASDGGTFAFGDAGFYGSVPGLGLNPAGSGLPHSLNAPIVGMVPAADGQGYFVVASDGGVFAFGPGASFAGSCPGIGGCSGPAVSVIPDSSGNGYWLFTATGNVYTFGDAPYLGTPGNVGSPVTSAVRTPDGKGYWVLVAKGTVYGYGDALNYGSPGGQLGGQNPATAVFTTSDGGGYWVVSAAGAVDPYGDAPNDGGMAGTKLNGAIIAATGF